MQLNHIDQADPPIAMSPLFHAINIVTLATWLSVAGFGTVGIVVPVTLEIIGKPDEPEDPYKDLESTFLTEDFTTGDLPPSQETDTGTTGEGDETDVPFAEEETLLNLVGCLLITVVIVAQWLKERGLGERITSISQELVISRDQTAEAEKRAIALESDVAQLDEAIAKLKEVGAR